MRIGDTVIWRGHLYVLRGFEPMSVPDPHADLENMTTGETIRAPIVELDEADGDPSEEATASPL
jgi:hypothetical protein